MPNINGRIYIDPTPDPDIGVSIIGDVKKVLGSNSNNVSTLCSSSNINPWARYKPERYAGTTAEEKRHGHTRPISYSMRKQNNFGLEVPYCPSFLMNGIIHDYLEDTDMKLWEYLQPRGNVNADLKEFYRIQDFSRIPSDDTDPHQNDEEVAPHRVYGYNHNAQPPFLSWMDMTGVTYKTDGHYEVNVAASGGKITLYFENTVGDELHLQDFISFDIPTEGYKWRPILQVFKDSGNTDWWESSRPYVQAICEPITQNEHAIWRAELTLDPAKFPYGQYGKPTIYHLCVGIGCTDDNGNIYDSDGKSLFLLPFSQEQEDTGNWPFYYKFSVMNHAERVILADALQYYGNTSMGYRWINATGEYPQFTITTAILQSRMVGLTMRISKGSALTFVSDETPSSSTTLKIYAKEMIGGISSPSPIPLTPSVGPTPGGQQAPWAEKLGGTPITAGEGTEYETFYATMTIGDIPADDYRTGQYYLSIKINTVETEGAGSFSIRKVSQ